MKTVIGQVLPVPVADRVPATFTKTFVLVATVNVDVAMEV